MKPTTLISAIAFLLFVTSALLLFVNFSLRNELDALKLNSNSPSADAVPLMGSTQRIAAEPEAKYETYKFEGVTVESAAQQLANSTTDTVIYFEDATIEGQVYYVKYSNPQTSVLISGIEVEYSLDDMSILSYQSNQIGDIGCQNYDAVVETEVGVFYLCSYNQQIQASLDFFVSDIKPAVPQSSYLFEITGEGVDIDSAKRLLESAKVAQFSL